MQEIVKKGERFKNNNGQVSISAYSKCSLKWRHDPQDPRHDEKQEMRTFGSRFAHSLKRHDKGLKKNGTKFIDENACLEYLKNKHEDHVNNLDYLNRLSTMNISDLEMELRLAMKKGASIHNILSLNMIIHEKSLMRRVEDS